jgi:hypothetical protein
MYEGDRPDQLFHDASRQRIRIQTRRRLLQGSGTLSCDTGNCNTGNCNTVNCDTGNCGTVNCDTGIDVIVGRLIMIQLTGLHCKFKCDVVDCDTVNCISNNYDTGMKLLDSNCDTVNCYTVHCYIVVETQP